MGENKTEQMSNHELTVTEKKKWYEEQCARNYAAASNALHQLRDLSKNTTKTISSFSKSTLRQYLQNIGNNEQNLRNLSRYLYYRSQVYYRLIRYHASMFCMNARSVIPSYDLVKGNDKTKTLKSYYETLQVLDKMNLQYEISKAAVINFREDVFYGIAFYDDTGMFILPIDPDYAKITGVYSTGDYAYQIDMSYYKNRQYILEYLGEPLQSMYNAYGDKAATKWQPVPDEYCVCFKARPDDYETVVPIFSGLFNSLISLLDMEDLQAIADEQQIYKLVWLELETLSNARQPDDWKVDPDIAVEYFNKLLEESLPDYAAGAVVPGKLQTISFDSDQATDTNKVQKSTETVLNTSGGAQILNSASISGTTAFHAAIHADCEMATSLLLPQYQSWVNRFLSYQVSNPAKVVFANVSPYTIEEYKDRILKDATYGLPTKLLLNSLNGFSELDTMALNFLEEECLGLSDKFKPLQSSHTQTSENESGGQTKTDDQLTDEGEASKDKRDKAKG
mgnify:FL=1